MGTDADPTHDDARFAYLETEGGLAVRIRPATPDDEQLLIDGFEQLSDRSRYQRFFSSTPHLSPSTIDQLLDAGADHVILVAFAADGGDEEWTPAGGVRAVWLDDEPGTAELAVTVIDPFQGRGLGTLLTAAVATVAADRGITALSAEVLTVNEPMLAVLRSFGAELQRHQDGATVITARLDTADAAANLSIETRRDLLAATTPADPGRARNPEPD